MYTITVAGVSQIILIEMINILSSTHTPFSIESCQSQIISLKNLKSGFISPNVKATGNTSKQRFKIHNNTLQ